MSDEITNEGEGQNEVNFDEKLQALEQKHQSSLEEVKRQNQELMNAVKQLSEFQTQSAPAPKAESDESLSDLLYSDPQAYTQKIIEQTRQSVSQEIQQVRDQEARKEQVLTQLTRDFPELADQNADLTKEAIKIYGQLPDNLKNNPDGAGFDSAVYRAAAQLGVKPISQRASNDDFTISGKGAAGKKSKPGKVSRETLEVARKMGLNPDDPKLVKSLEQRAQRNFRSWQ
jgi:hypothetical protein